MLTVTFFGVPVKACSPKAPAWERVARRVEEFLQQRLGREVEVRYVDLFSAAGQEYAPVLAEIQRSNLPIPVLALGDEILHAGAPIPVSRLIGRLEPLLRSEPTQVPGWTGTGAE